MFYYRNTNILPETYCSSNKYQVVYCNHFLYYCLDPWVGPMKNEWNEIELIRVRVNRPVQEIVDQNRIKMQCRCDGIPHIHIF